MGFPGMPDRAVLLGGQVTVSGVRGKGATVKVRTPLHARPAAKRRQQAGLHGRIACPTTSSRAWEARAAAVRVEMPCQSDRARLRSTGDRRRRHSPRHVPGWMLSVS